MSKEEDIIEPKNKNKIINYDQYDDEFYSEEDDDEDEEYLEYIEREYYIDTLHIIHSEIIKHVDKNSLTLCEYLNFENIKNYLNNILDIKLY